jgi:hypothetical protein
MRAGFRLADGDYSRNAKPDLVGRVLSEIGMLRSMALASSPVLMPLCCLKQVGPKTCVFIVRDRPGALEALQFFNFVRCAKTDHISKLLACPLNPLDAALGHACPLGNHVRQHTNVWEKDYADHPERFFPAR